MPIFHIRSHERLFPVAVLLLLLAADCLAGDWPQILGPQRNGVANNEKLAGNWAKTKPSKLWTMPIGQGYAGPVVQGDKVLVFHRMDDIERLDCVDADTGKPIWFTEWKTSYRSRIDSDAGPRCCPLIDNELVYVLGAGGNLHCAKLAAGSKVWSRKLGREYKADDGYFGFGSGPIVLDGTLMVNVGGEKGAGKIGAGIVALDTKNGETLWTKLKDQASYAAPIVWPQGDETAVIFVTRLNVVGLQPKDGEIIFQIPFGKRGPTVNAATPLLLDGDRLFLTASYGIGAKCFWLANKAAPRVLWESDEILSSQYPTPVSHAGHLYGVHGREDGAPASLRCVDDKTGEVKWKKDHVGMAHTIIADGKLLVLTVDGELILTELNSTAYNELGKVLISKGTTRALPALANGKLFGRDTNGKLFAWKLP